MPGVANIVLPSEAELIELRAKDRAAVATALLERVLSAIREGHLSLDAWTSQCLYASIGALAGGHSLAATIFCRNVFEKTGRRRRAFNPDARQVDLDALDSQFEQARRLVESRATGPDK